MATDSKGTFFGRGNRGLATILGRTQQGSFFDSANRVAASNQAQRAKEQEEMFDLLQPEDVWAPFQQTANSILEEGIEKMAAGDLDRAGALKIAVRYSTANGQAKSLQEDHNKAIDQYYADKRINAAKAAELRWQKVVGDGSLENLSRSAAMAMDDEFFADEMGGSAAYEVPEVVRAATSQLRLTLSEYLGSEESEYVGPGAKRFKRERIESLVNEAFTIGLDEKGVKTVKVKDIETLRESGLLDILFEDRAFNRIVVDRLYEKTGRSPDTYTQDELHEEAVRLINLYGADQQEVKVGEQTDTARYSVPRSSGSGSKKDSGSAKRKYWWQALSSGNPELQSLALSRFSTTFPFTSYAQLQSIMAPQSKEQLATDDERLLRKYDDMGLSVVRSGYHPTAGPYLVIKADNPKGKWKNDSVKRVYIDVDGFNEQDWYALYDNATELSISEQDEWLPQLTPEEIRQRIQGATPAQQQQTNTSGADPSSSDFWN